MTLLTNPHTILSHDNLWFIVETCSIGKINTSSGQSTGEMHNLWIKGIGCLTEGEILTVTVGGKTGAVELSPFLQHMFGFNNSSDEDIIMARTEVIGFNEKRTDSNSTADTSKIAAEVGVQYKFPSGFDLSAKVSTENSTSTTWEETNSRELSTTRTEKLEVIFPLDITHVQHAALRCCPIFTRNWSTQFIQSSDHTF